MESVFNNVYLLIHIAEQDRTGEVFHMLMRTSSLLGKYLESAPAFRATLRDSFLDRIEKTTKLGDRTVVYYYTRLHRWSHMAHLHRIDGPAITCVDKNGVVTETWYLWGERLTSVRRELPTKNNTPLITNGP